MMFIRKGSLKFIIYYYNQQYLQKGHKSDGHGHQKVGRCHQQLLKLEMWFTLRGGAKREETEAYHWGEACSKERKKRVTLGKVSSYALFAIETV